MEETKVVEVPAKFKDIVEAVEKLTLIELHELVKLLEEKWGVSAAAAVAVAAGPALPAAHAGVHRRRRAEHAQDWHEEGRGRRLQEEGRGCRRKGDVEIRIETILVGVVTRTK